MTVIRTAAESILRQKNPSRARVDDLAEDIVSETGQLARLVEGLGLLAQADAKRDTVVREAVDVGSMLAEVAHVGALLAQSHEVRFEADMANAGGLMRGDGDRLRQLFAILLDNAGKFSPKGSVVRLLAHVQKRRLVVRVLDEGAGIPEVDLPHIFDRFYRAATARQKEGSGLGLAIAQVVVEQHGGTIGVRSVVGQGSEFAVDLPLEEVAPEPVKRAARVKNAGLK